MVNLETAISSLAETETTYYQPVFDKAAWHKKGFFSYMLGMP